VTSFVLLPGAGGASVYWHRVAPLLEKAGFEAVAVELPGADETAGLDEYRARTLTAIGAREDVILVAQSLGGFTAPLVASRAPAVRAIVLVNAMIPEPGETEGAWGTNTGSTPARVAAAKHGGYSAEFDVATYFCHDLPEDLAREVEQDERPQSNKVFEEPCSFDRWPAVPTHVIVGTEDRLFPRDFQHRVAKERLGADVSIEDVRGGHLVALSKPTELAERLVAFARQLQRSGTPGG
jgi:pimeloyl-ACP methyl ester carboxylesterase